MAPVNLSVNVTRLELAPKTERICLIDGKYVLIGHVMQLEMEINIFTNYVALFSAFFTSSFHQ